MITKLADLAPDDAATIIIDELRTRLALLPGCKIMLLVDGPLVKSEADGPALLFSELSYRRAIELVLLAQQNTMAAKHAGLQTIANAMAGVTHG